MKKNWERPLMAIEEFAANEYVAACGDSGKVYYFECNAPAGTIYYYKNSDGTIDGNYTGNGNATMISYEYSYSPCGKKHEAESTNPFYDGFVDRNYNGRCDNDEAAIIWRGPNNNNGHATAQLDMDAWETAKS